MGTGGRARGGSWNRCVAARTRQVHPSCRAGEANQGSLIPVCSASTSSPRASAPYSKRTKPSVLPLLARPRPRPPMRNSALAYTKPKNSPPSYAAKSPRSSTRSDRSASERMNCRLRLSARRRGERRPRTRRRLGRRDGRLSSSSCGTSRVSRSPDLLSAHSSFDPHVRSHSSRKSTDHCLPTQLPPNCSARRSASTPTICPPRPTA